MLKITTPDGLVVPAVTADQMREVDRIATEETGPNLFQMMENAGRSLAGLAMEQLGDNMQRTQVVVLAGAGGNGGGGICAARHLANHGVDVILVLSDTGSLGSVPRLQNEIYRQTSGDIAEDPGTLAPGLIIDALIGYGLRAAPRGRAAELIQWSNASRAPVLALDVPSGVDSTSGETPGAAVKATWTMTLALPKTGLLPALVGDLYLADIGIPAGTYRLAGIDYVPPFRSSFVVPLTVNV